MLTSVAYLSCFTKIFENWPKANTRERGSSIYALLKLLDYHRIISLDKW